ncbi:MAG: hypothetical protein HN726_03885 [Candidatus Magasanikbacteria bacterium]|jgi:hypothetical protein|nr:hypothetical protein [Candidatus Magasanikbacteria bacterium]MBT4221274.1 hypothetical protein [Candidatus Magasanikbacteria bacterium]MBT4350420.1 hypothetical protein [Candidatus Magasanikbacteria bacterium]MBT4542033.1 hypothetical protein [Candidatus Magasanikbacteria bacterium]MBT6253398.1 hypothetical protein [Candidatus Magasanikbacteria bacterium]
MKLNFNKEYTKRPEALIRVCGYGKLISPRTGQVSYARHLRRGARYPRFHCYIDEKDTTFTINLHLDQKQASYGTHTAHGGDYDGQAVEEEAKRIQEVIDEHLIEKKEVPVDTPTYDLSMFG